MPIRLLALDIDGTLTNQVHVVSEANMLAIGRAKEAGVFVTLATGRGSMASRHILEAIGTQGPSIHYGGAWIVEAPGAQTLQLAPLEPDVVHEVLLLAHSLEATAQLYQNDLVLVEKSNPFTERYVQKFGLPLELIPRALERTFTNVPKILMLCDQEREDELIRACKEGLGDAAAVSRSQVGFIEINCPGVNKASGLAYVADMLGIAREDCAAIGDSYLDMEMLQWAGVGVCVENGVPAAKACADLVMPACDENGVAAYIQQYIL
mgnify:CR=1 FL=1|jgi:hypothetical protein